MQICALFPSSLSFLTFSQSNSHFTQTEGERFLRDPPSPLLFLLFPTALSSNASKSVLRSTASIPPPKKVLALFRRIWFPWRCVPSFFLVGERETPKRTCRFCAIQRESNIYIAARGGDERFKLKCRNRRPGFPELSPFSPFPFLSPFLPPFFKVSGKFDNERKSQRGWLHFFLGKYTKWDSSTKGIKNREKERIVWNYRKNTFATVINMCMINLRLARQNKGSFQSISSPPTRRCRFPPYLSETDKTEKPLLRVYGKGEEGVECAIVVTAASRSWGHKKGRSERGSISVADTSVKQEWIAEWQVCMLRLEGIFSFWNSTQK